jgi:hypothetical protein
MNAARPMNQQDDLAGLGIDVGNNLFDQRTNDALLQPCICCRSSPHRLQVTGQRCK